MFTVTVEVVPSLANPLSAARARAAIAALPWGSSPRFAA